MSPDPSHKASEWEARVRIVREHYESKGYRVHSGLQFGCELVLYADDPSKVHSDFCVHVLPEGKAKKSTLRVVLLLAFSSMYSNKFPSIPRGVSSDGTMDWRMIQSMVRLMPDLHKTLLLANLCCDEAAGSYAVQEIAMTSEHAPFRHKHAERVRQASQAPGQQTKAHQRKRQHEEAAELKKCQDSQD